MPQALYIVRNALSPTTAAPVKVATGTSIITLLQIEPATLPISIVEWGISFDASAAGTPIECELIDTGTVFATVTSLASATNVVQLTDPAATAPSLTYGTSATGFTASAEGTITAVRELDYQLVAPTNQYLKQFPLGQEPNVVPGHSLRIRVTATTTVNATCYIVFGQG